MPTADRLLRLYPSAWRERYGDEFLATLGPDALRPQQVIDIVSGAIDAWLSPEVRRAIAGSSNEGAQAMLKAFVCGRAARVTPFDGVIAAGVILALAFAGTRLGAAALQQGWPTLSGLLMLVAFPGSFVISMPFWMLKGQPWKAQMAIVGGTLAVLVALRLSVATR
jgi:hypothetical protein